MTSDEVVACPLCGGFLCYRCFRPRKLKAIDGGKRILLLRRFKCRNCRKLHTEIPDIIQPHKHYDSDTIQSVLDGDGDSGRCHAEDSTMRRWKAAFAANEGDMSQRLSSIYAKATDEKPPIAAGSRAIDHIRADQVRWLAFVMTLLINNGHKICSRFAFWPAPLISKIEP